MRLAHINWVRAQEYFQENDLVILAIGSIECHGRHNALGTDTLVPNDLLDRIEKKMPNVLIAPTIPYGACDDLMDFSGTISLGAELLKQVVTKVTDALYTHGARHFVLINGHGGNTRVLEEVGVSLNRRGAWCALMNWWIMAGEINPAWKGGHGGGEETAAIMAIDPSYVDDSLIAEQMLVNDAGETFPTIGFDFVQYKGVRVELPRDVARYAQNGWIGPDHPKDATIQWGKEMLQATADYMVDFIGEFQKLPLPTPKKGGN